MQNQRSVPFFDYPQAYLKDRSKYLEIIDDVFSRGSFILQKELADFENELVKFTNAKNAVGVANATDGLELAWMAAGLKRGDEVICSSHTMLATASSIVTAGGVPIPVDIGDDNLIDPKAIESAITPRTVGIMPTHLNGRTCNMDLITEIASKYKLIIVEDAAQALGSRFKGKHAGTFGVAGSISFYPAKVLGCFGDGGAVISNSNEIFDKIYQLHDHGKDKFGDVQCWGRNSRLDNVQAAILSFKLKSYDQVIKRRRDIATFYTTALQKIEQLKLPPMPGNGDHYDIFQNYEIMADRRDELKLFLSQRGVGTLIQWGGKGIHQWEKLNFNLVLPKTEIFFQKCLMLPMNAFITDEDVNYVCQLILDFYRH